MSLNTHKESDTQLLDIGYYVNLVLNRWFRISLFTLLCTLISVMIALSITPTYKATATLLIESTQQNAISIEQVVGIDTKAAEYYQTQYEIIKSNQVAMRVIDKLDLINHPEFNPSLNQSGASLTSQIKQQLLDFALIQSYFGSANNSEVDLEAQARATYRQVLSRFKANLTVTPIPKTQLVRISFESKSPVLAAKIANEVGHAYIENSLESKIVATEQASSWINTRLAELKQKLDDSEQALLAFLQQQQLIDDSGIEALTSSELTNLTNRLAQATDQRIQAQSMYNALAQNRTAQLSTLASIPAISNHPQVRDVRLAEINAERTVSELSKRYGPKHDKMIQANAQLDSIQRRGDQVIAKLLAGIESELSTARTQEQLLQQELDSKKNEFQSLSVVKREYDALKREVDTNAKLYDLFLTRQKETSATSDYSTASARFSDTALVPSTPYKPQRSKIVMVACLASLFFACLVVIVLDGLRKTITNLKDFEEKLGLLPLAALPKLKAKNKQLPLNNLDKAKKQQAQVYREKVDSLRTSLLLNTSQSPYSRVTVITSAMPNEGKTSTGLQLARSFASLEKVLLIDTDMRKPSLFKSFGVPRSQLGLTNYVHQHSQFEECIVDTEVDNLSLVVTGMATANPQETLNSERFKQFIDSAIQRYDRVIIDTPPTLPVSDSLIIGSLIGQVTLVVKANATKAQTVQTAIDLLSRHQIQISGTVLNAALTDKKIENDYYYAYSQ